MDIRRTARLAATIALAVISADCARHDPREGRLEKGGRREAREREELRMLRDPATGTIPRGIRRSELAYAATMPLRRQSAGLASAFEWRSRGPWNRAGRARSVGVDLRGDDTIITGAQAGGIWRSSDRGRSWMRAIVPATFTGLGFVAQDPRPGHQDTWYATTGAPIGQTASLSTAQYYLGDGIMMSFDNGRSWQEMSSTVLRTPQTYDSEFDVTWRIAIDPTARGSAELYVACGSVIARSSDGGATWRAALATSTGASPYADVEVSPTGVVYATLSSGGNRRGIHRSTNGTQWTNITPPNLPTPYDRISIAIDPDDENIVHFFASMRMGSTGDYPGDGSPARLYRYRYDTLDGAGANGTWEDLTASLPTYPEAYFGQIETQRSLNMHVRAAPHGSSAVLVGATNLYRSMSGFGDIDGSEWVGGYLPRYPLDLGDAVINEYFYPGHHNDQHWVAFSGSRRGVAFSASDGGIHVTENIEADTVAWTPLNNGLLISQLHDVAIDPGTPGSRLVVGSFQDDGTWSSSSEDQRASWVKRSSEDGMSSSIVPGAREMIIGKPDGVAWRVLLDAEGRMVDSARIDPAGAERSFRGTHTYDPTDPHRLFFMGGGVIWRNNDITRIPLGTAAWTPIGWERLEATRLRDTAARYRAAAVSAANPARRLWLGTDNGRVFRLDGADTATSAPVEVTGAGFPTGGYVYRIVVDPADGDRAVAVFSNYSVISLFITNDAGATWTPIAGNLEEQPDGKGAGPSVRAFAFVRQGDRVTYLAGTTTGLYSTSKLDGMETVWQQEGAATIGQAVVSSIASRGVDGYVAIATIGSGVFDATVTPTASIARDAATTGLAASLVPNVTDRRTTLELTLPAPVDDLVLEIYDVLGVRRERRSLGAHDAGRVSAVIGLEDLDEGRYFCRVAAGARQQVLAVEVMRR